MKSVNLRRERLLQDIAGAITSPIVLMLMYGIYRIIRYGIQGNSIFYSYVPISLSLLGLIGLGAYLSKIDDPNRSFVNMICAFAGYLPYISLCYMIFFLGFYGLFTLISEFHFTVIVRSLIFITWGYRSIKHLHILTEVGHECIDQNNTNIY